jgi:hypothetical protein
MRVRVAQQNGFWNQPETVTDDSMPVTEKRAFLKTRLGQDRFRALVLERWDYRCAITKAGILLTASHIKPWKSCSDFERLDATNGICLSPVFDRAFDSGIITFRFDGRLVLSPAIPRLDARRLGLDINVRLRGLGPPHRPYLEYHHTKVWQNGGIRLDAAV